MAKLRCPTITVSRISTTGRTPSPGTGRVRARKATKLARPRVGAPEAGDPALIPLPVASPARRTVNLPLSIITIRFWLPGRFVVAGFRGLQKNAGPTGDRRFDSTSLQQRVCEPSVSLWGTSGGDAVPKLMSPPRPAARQR
jgi:hypothetical protein